MLKNEMLHVTASLNIYVKMYFMQKYKSEFERVGKAKYAK